MSTANQKQVGGNHYKHGGEELWDRIERLGLNYFQGSAIKYIERCYLKGNTVQDLLKAVHYLEKLIEIETAKTSQGINGSDACCRVGSDAPGQHIRLHTRQQTSQRDKETVERELREAREASMTDATDHLMQWPNLVNPRNFRQHNVIDPKRD